MSDLRELYQDVIMDHNRKPRNFGPMDEPTNEAEGYNPLCGDQVSLHLKVSQGIIEEITFEGVGCAISTASASLMTEQVKGKSVQEAEDLFETFHRMVTTGANEDDTIADALQALQGVREFPIRIKCATLPWHTLEAALHGSTQPVKTE